MSEISTEEVGSHNNDTSCWVTRDHRVYDVTAFLARHPGGKRAIIEFAGNDVTFLMSAPESHAHSRNAYALLNDMQIGVLKGHGEGQCSDKIENAPDPVNWLEPILPQVGELGELYPSWVHVPINRRIRLFSSNAVELLSKSPWFCVPIVWVPIILYFFIQGFHIILTKPTVTIFTFRLSLDVWATPLIFLGGFCTWPIIEYLIHRFIFHATPPASWPDLIRFHFIMHGQHHKSPHDPYRLVFPPVPALLIALPIYSIYHAVLPYCLVNMWVSGTALCYVFYDLTHYYIHHGSPHPNSYMGRLKRWHMKHHYVDPDNGFGVSSPFLDYPFGTVFSN